MPEDAASVEHHDSGETTDPNLTLTLTLTPTPTLTLNLTPALTPTPTPNQVTALLKGVTSAILEEVAAEAL